MDPLSISVGVATLVKICAQAISSCREIATRFQDAPRIILTLQSECSTTRESLALIYKLINKSDTTALSNLSISDSLADSFNIALTGCTVTLSVLDNELQDILNHREHEDRPGFRQKAKYVWNENTLNKAMDELRGQREALTLLVTVVQSHSLTEILDRLREKANVFKTIRQNTNTMRRPVEHSGDISDDDLNTLDTYSIFSEASEERPAFEDEILRSRAYRKVYDSINKSSRRPRHRRNLHPEPLCDLLDEDLIGLHEYPALKPTYSEELQREMLAGDKVQDIHENLPSRSPSGTRRASEETVEPEVVDLEVSTAVQPAHSSNIAQQLPAERNPAGSGTTESSDQHRVSYQGQIPEDVGSANDAEQVSHDNSSPKPASFNLAEGAESPGGRRSSAFSTSAPTTDELKTPTKWVPPPNHEDQHTSLTPNHEDVERASLVKDYLKPAEKSPLPTLSENPSTNLAGNQNRNSISGQNSPFASLLENLEEAARRLAQARLAELGSNLPKESDSDENIPRRIRTSTSILQTKSDKTDNKRRLTDQDRRRALEAAHKSLTSRRKTIDEIVVSRLDEADNKRRQAERDALLAAAHKNVTSRMKAMDEDAFSKSDETSAEPRRERLKREARGRAQRAEEDRKAHAGKVHIGGGKWIEQSEIEAIARARLQPTLDDIAAKAKQQRTRDEDIRLEKARAAADRIQSGRSQGWFGSRR